MSQHADILTFHISKGIQRGQHAEEIVFDIQDVLEVSEYSESFTDLKTVKKHVYSHAKWMLTQRDGLYGAGHAKLTQFINDLWILNQWLETPDSSA